MSQLGSLYTRLGVDSDATQAEIKSAYRNKAKELHPDKNGNSQASSDRFKWINNAYKILSNPQSRRQYDSYAGTEQMPKTSSQKQMEEQAVGTRHLPRTQDLQYELKLTLADFYCGCLKKLSVDRDVLCPDCEPLRRSQEDIYCEFCDGSGTLLCVKSGGRGLIRRVSQVCPKCDGRGKQRVTFACGRCGGTGMQRIKRNLTVCVPAGAPVGHEIRFRGEANERPGHRPGSFIVRLCPTGDQLDRKSQQPLFYRLTNKKGNPGAHLQFDMDVTLADLLTGFSFTFIHLDGRVVNVTTPRDTILPLDAKLRLPGEGMPVLHLAKQKGDLFIQTTLKWPLSRQLSETTEEFKHELRRLFGYTHKREDKCSNSDTTSDGDTTATNPSSSSQASTGNINSNGGGIEAILQLCEDGEGHNFIDPTESWSPREIDTSEDELVLSPTDSV